MQPMQALRPWCTCVYIVVLLSIEFADAAWHDIFNPWRSCNTTAGGALGGMAGLCTKEGEGAADRLLPQPLLVFGVGLPKTGTSSLCEALDQLGYKTYHMKRVASTPGHVDVWHEAATTGKISDAFDLISADGFNATTDMPMAVLFREGLFRFPDAKFVLTVRDSPMAWAQSFERHGQTMREFTSGVFAWFPVFRKLKVILFWLRTLLPYLEPGECFMVPSSHAKCIESYQQHNQDVIDAIPSHQLLHFNVKQGFPPLCNFLGVPPERCPSQFPHANEAGQVLAAGMAARCVNYGSFVLLLAIVYWMYLSLLKLEARRLQSAAKQQ